MKVLDLGHFDSDILFFGGPYSNAQALDAVMHVAGDGHMICTGDLVAYCGAPRAVAERVRAANIPVVAGNCEKQLAARALDCGCGFEEGTQCDMLSAGWFSFASREVPSDLCDWMGMCPDVITLSCSAGRGAVIHGGVSDVARFLWSVSPQESFEDEVRRLVDLTGPLDFVIAGHSGIAFEREISGLRWLNAGVIGMPAHTGSQATEYLRLSQQGVFSFETLSYDVAGAVADMQAAGLTQGYHVSLQSGIWPSEDVLPAALRRG